MTTTSDAQLAVASAFGSRLHAVALRMLRDEDEAHDALQDAFLSAYRALPSYRGEAQLSTWLHRIVINAARMRLRARRRRREEPLRDLLLGMSEDGRCAHLFGGWSVSPQEACESAETRRIVRGCIARLREPYRSVVLLREVEHLSTEETAHVLGIAAGAVKTRLHRARKALRTLLAPHFERS